jgi:hypothetical protein
MHQRLDRAARNISGCEWVSFDKSREQNLGEQTPTMGADCQSKFEQIEKALAAYSIYS